jgi:hypothetical protein
MKLALFYNLNVTKVYINSEKCVIHYLNFTLYEFILEEGGVKFMKDFGGAGPQAMTVRQPVL